MDSIKLSFGDLVDLFSFVVFIHSYLACFECKFDLVHSLCILFVYLVLFRFGFKTRWC